MKYAIKVNIEGVMTPFRVAKVGDSAVLKALYPFSEGREVECARKFSSEHDIVIVGWGSISGCGDVVKFDDKKTAEDVATDFGKLHKVECEVVEG